MSGCSRGGCRETWSAGRWLSRTATRICAHSSERAREGCRRRRHRPTRGARARGRRARRTLSGREGGPAAPLRLAGPGVGRHVHIHALSDPQLLPVDGSALQSGTSGGAEGTGSARAHPPALGQFRSRTRSAGGARRARAKQLGVDPAVWSYLTGEREEIARFASRFGVSIMPADSHDAGDRSQPADGHHRSCRSALHHPSRQRMDAAGAARGIEECD